MQFHDNLEIPGGDTRWQIKVEVGLGYCSAQDKCLNLYEKWYLKENMVGTTSTDTRWTYYKGTIILREASMIRYTSCPWAWTQSSRSTPTSSMHNLSFTSRVWWSCSVEKFSLAKYQKSMTHENFRVHTYKGRHRFNPSGYHGNIYHKLQ